jgi:acetoin utilization protein AcuB
LKKSHVIYDDMTLAAEPMTREVIIAPPTLPLCDAWTLMCRERFRHLPVVSDGLLVGILSDRDILLRSTLEAGEVVVPDTTVGAAATPAPYVCEPHTDVCDLVRMMTGEKIDAVPVVDDAKRLVGLVTSTDLMLLLIRLDEAKVPLPFQFELKEHSAVFPA